MNFVSKMKKGLASITVAALATTSFVPANANLGFTDDAEIPSWADTAIEDLMLQGVLSGNADGSFAPSRQLNRAEVSKIIVLATGIDLDTTGGPHFPDVEEGAWYYDYVETMYNYGWINGYPDGYFRPGIGINRAEIAKMVVNAFAIDQDLSGAPHFDDVSEGDWFFGYVETAYNNDLIRGYGDGTFGPANAVTRAETAKIVYDSQLVAYQPNPIATEGTLEVMLSDSTPRGTNIPYNATSVPFTTVELTASDDSDVEISSLTFTRLGLGDNDDFDNVWLEIDGFKVGNDKSINNDDVVELRFNPPVVVPAGQTLVADVVASTKYSDTTDGKNVGHHNRLAVVSADDIVSTAVNVVGDFPIEGEEMEVAEYQVSEIKFSSLGSDTTVDVGDQFIELGKFRMLNSSNSNKDVELRAITFKNDGSAELEDNLENVALYVSGEQVSAESIIDGDYITFRLDNGVTGGYIIEDGDSRIFSLRADVVSAEKGDVINFKVDNFEDIVGVEIGTAFGVKAISGNSNGLTLGTDTTTSGDSCEGEDAEDNCARLRAYAIDSGDLNISRDPASLGNQEYAPGSNDVVFLTARLVVDQPLIVDGVRIDVAATEGTSVDTLAELNSTFDNFRVYLNDKLIDSENEFTQGATTASADAYLDFGTNFEIAGTSILKVVGNIEDGAVTGSKLKLQVQNDTSVRAFASPEYISTGDQVNSDEVLGSAVASFVEVSESALTITKTDGLTDGDKIVAGVDDVTFLKFVLDNNDSGDVSATSVTVQAQGADAAATFSNYTAAVFVDGQQQGSARNLNTSGQATFNDLAVVIPSAGQKEFEVVVDTIEASADTDAIADTIRFNVVAVDADNVENGQTVTVWNGGTTVGTHELDTGNVLQGAQFEFVQSGTLDVVGVNQTVEADVVVANSTNGVVYKLRFDASNDEVQVKDLYLQNTAYAAGSGTTSPAFGDRVTFKLYNEAGQLLQEKQMTSGQLHFELANQDRIRVPKDGSTTVTVKVDVRDITKANQTGSILALALNETLGENGVEALTAATGADILAANIDATADNSGKNFVAYRSNISVKHASTQPNVDASSGESAFYRFTVSADAAKQIEFKKATFKVDFVGFTSTDSTVDIRRVVSNGTEDIDGVNAIAVTSGGEVAINLPNAEQIPAGASQTYELYFAAGTRTVAANYDSSSDGVTVDIVEDSAYAAPAVEASQTGNIIWSDSSGSGAAADFLNGYLVDIDDVAKTNK